MNGFIESVTTGNFRDDFRIQTPTATVVTVADIPYAGLRVAGANTFAARTGQRAALSELNGGDGLFNRTARCYLYDKKVDSNDGPKRWDHQQQTSNQISAHLLSLSSGCGKLRRFVAVIPPVVDANGINRADRRMRKLIPPGDTIFSHVPHRQHVVVPG